MVLLLWVGKLLELSLPHDAFVGHCAEAFLLVDEQGVLAVHLEGYLWVACHEVVFTPFSGPVEKEAVLPVVVVVNGEVERHDVWHPSFVVVEGQAADVALPDDAVDVLVVGELPVVTSHGWLEG